MTDLIPYVIWTLIFILILFVAFVLYRDYEARKVARLKAEEELLLRCDKLVHVIKILPDRYCPLELKSMLLTYVVHGYAKVSAEKLRPEQVSYRKEMTLLFEETYEESYISSEEKVQTMGRLEQVQQALLKIPPFIKWQAEQKQIDRGSAKDYLEKIRYSHALSKIDLLVRQAEDLLELDKKAQSLEKYRAALAEAEQINLLVSCDELIERINNSIHKVERQLHINQSIQED